MARNKVVMGNGEMLIDLTNDTVTTDSLEEGFTAHDRTGALISGTFPKKQMEAEIDNLKTGKVDKIPGKGLSTNDFTNAYKEKIDNLATEIGNAKIKFLGETIIPSESWQNDSTFIDYPYKATVTVEGITEKDWWCTVLTPDHTKPVIIQALSPYVFVGENSFSVFSNEKFTEQIILENAVFERRI